MDFWQLELITDSNSATLINDLLTNLAADAITNTKQNNDHKIAALFTTENAAQVALTFITTQLPANYLKSSSIIKLPDENWQQRSIKDIKPINIGNHLCIHPSWESPTNNRQNIIIDPGLAFGTGTHATTALCLEWLDQNIQGNETVIDYGCGSGILAIAAIKLGATKAWATDIDPEAITVTNENCQINQINSHQFSAVLPEQLPTIQADILIANILANPLIELAPQLAQLVKPQGKIILSGILVEQAAKVSAAYEPWFSMDPAIKACPWRKQGSRDDAEWVLLTGIRR